MHFEENEKGKEIVVKKKTAKSKERIELARKNTAKGVKNAIASKLTIDDYEYCLKQMDPLKKEMNTI